MQTSSRDTGDLPHAAPRRAWPAGLLVLLLCAGASGCAALTNPVTDGVPVNRLPPELLASSKDDEVTIPLTLLGQKPPTVYRLAAGDVLGIWIEGVLGEAGLTPPLHLPPQVQIREQRRLPAALGYPVPVREDGTISLPWVAPVVVQGMTLGEVEGSIRRLYTVEKQVLKPGKDRIQVTLLDRRQHHVLVLRQESSAFITPIVGNVVSSGKRGTGHLVDLPEGENDVLHALVQSGGMPGLDAYNEVIVFRSCFRCDADRTALLQQLEQAPPEHGHCLPGLGGPVVQIPLRIHRGLSPPVRPEDVVLHSGDVVFLEARDRDVFFTGGLLPPGEHVLPRDRDLDVVEAVSLVQGTLFNGAFSTSNLSGNLIAGGIGNPSPSLLTVLRRTPRGDRIPIRVDLGRALHDGRESILVQAGDVLILQEKPGEALARYFSQTFFNFSLAWQVVHERFAAGFFDVSAPERIPARISAGTLPR